MPIMRITNIKKYFSVLSLCFLFFIFGFWFLFNNLISQAQIVQDNYIPGEMLIKLKQQEKIYKVHYPDQTNLLEMQQIVLKMSTVEHAEPNYTFHLAYLPNDPFYHEQWAFDKIQAPRAWDFTKGGSEDTIIAILDSGVDIDHPDLKDNIWTNKKEILGDGIDNDNNGYIDDYYGWDFINNSPDPRPKLNGSYNERAIHHGTVIAGLAAAVGDNNEGITGLAWKSKIMALRVLDSQGNGSIEKVIQAVNYAKNNGAKIINLSFVGPNRSDFLAQTLKEAWRAGIVIVAAAGNESNGQTEDLDLVPAYPICFDADDVDNYIIGVAATDQMDRKADFSNYGSKCVDISVPGSRIYGPMVYRPNLPNFQELYGGYWSGTSVAVPLVSGTAALLKGVNPLINNVQIRDVILNQSDNIDAQNPNYIGKIGQGRLNVYKAVEYVYNQLVVAPQFAYIVTGAGPGGGPHVKVVKSNGLTMSSFMAYDPAFSGGVKVAAGDVDGNGRDEIITVPASRGGPHVRIFDFNGRFKSHFFALDKNWRGGLNITTCDLDNDGKDEIIIGPGSGGLLPYIYIYNNLGQLQNKFLAYAPNFKGEIKVACADIDSDGENEIITGAGPGGGPHVRIFNKDGWVETHFFAFLESFRGGINVAAGDVDGDGKNEIIVSIASRASPYVRIFDYFGFLKSQFLAYDKDFYKGVNLAVGDLNNDHKLEIIVGTGLGGGPQTRIFNQIGEVKSQFFAYVQHFLGGVNVAVIKGE